MITINIPTNGSTGMPVALQPTDAGEKFTGIATFGVTKDLGSIAGSSSFAGLLNVEMSSNTNTSGETRLLVKVSTPYYTTKSQSCGCDGTSIPSFAKAGTIGAHVVLTLPRGFAKDYVASETTGVAQRQLNAVIGLLLQSMNGTGGETNGDPFSLINCQPDGMIHGSDLDSLGLYGPHGIVNRAIMGLRPAAPDKTYGSTAST